MAAIENQHEAPASRSAAALDSTLDSVIMHIHYMHRKHSDRTGPFQEASGNGWQRRHEEKGNTGVLESDMQRPVWPRDDPLHRFASAVPQTSPGFFPPEATVLSFPFHLTLFSSPSESNPRSAIAFHSIYASNLYTSANRNLGFCPLSLSRYNLPARFHTQDIPPETPSRLSIHLYHVHDYPPSPSRLAIPPSTFS